MKHTTDHLADIKAGKITKRNVIGLRKILHADLRRQERLSVSSTCPKYTHEEVMELEDAVEKYKPVVTGELHESGLKVLRSPRYRKRLHAVADIIEQLESFRLVRFDPIGRHGLQVVPVYQACAGRRSFTFRNIPWQSGGDGPELVPR